MYSLIGNEPMMTLKLIIDGYVLEYRNAPVVLTPNDSDNIRLSSVKY